jgi:outer membrane lipoprotein carrier protein
MALVSRRLLVVFSLALAGPLGCQDPPAPAPAASATPEAPTAAVSAAAPTPAASIELDAGAPSDALDAGATAATDAGKPDAGKTAGKDKDAGAAQAVADAGAKADAGSATAAADAGPPVQVGAAAAGSADAVAEQIDKIFVGKSTFTAKFKQEFVQKVSGAVKKSTGTVFVEKPNKISFRYDAPNKNRIVSDGTTLKVYVAEDSQMLVQPVQNTEYPGALSFIMGRGLRPSFTFTFNENAKATYTAGPVLHGKPRSPTPHYESVFFYVDQALLDKGDPNVIRRVLIVDAQGNRNRFDFEGASQPASIDAGEFVFTPPAGTNITKN